MAKRSIFGADTRGTAAGDVIGGGRAGRPSGPRPRAPGAVRIPRTVRNPALQRLLRSAALFGAGRGLRGRGPVTGRARAGAPGPAPHTIHMDSVLSRFTPGRILHRIVTTNKAAKWYAKFTTFLESFPRRSTWVRAVHLVAVGVLPPAVAIEFLDGVTCYYPGTTETQYTSMTRSASAGKHVWAFFYHRPYVVISGGRATARRRTADTHRRHGDPR